MEGKDSFHFFFSQFFLLLYFGKINDTLCIIYISFTSLENIIMEEIKKKRKDIFLKMEVHWCHPRFCQREEMVAQKARLNIIKKN